jgi:hypothetical protein
VSLSLQRERGWVWMCEDVDSIVIQPSISNLGSSGSQLNRDILNSRSTTHTGNTHSCSIIRNAILYGSIPGHISDSEAVVHSRECHPACCTSVSHRYYKIHINPNGNLPPLCSNGNTASARALSIRLSNAKAWGSNSENLQRYKQANRTGAARFVRGNNAHSK